MFIKELVFFLRVKFFSVLHKSDISEANAGGKSNPGAKIPLFRQYFRITLAAPNVFPSMLREPRPVLQENFIFVSLIWPSFSGLVLWLEMRALTEYGKHILTFGKIEFCILKKISPKLWIYSCCPLNFLWVAYSLLSGQVFRAAVFNDGYDMLVTTCALLCFACVTLYDLTPSSLSFSRAWFSAWFFTWL